MDDAWRRAVGVVADRVGQLGRVDRQLGRAREDLAPQRVGRVGEVDQVEVVARDPQRQDGRLDQAVERGLVAAAVAQVGGQLGRRRDALADGRAIVNR
jgi:hypothetical protein